MAAPITGISPLTAGVVDAATRTARTERGKGPDFAEALGDAFSKAGEAAKTSERMATAFTNGDPSVGMHEVMIASEKAGVQLRYAVTLKNKLLDAYRELMNTSI